MPDAINRRGLIAAPALLAALGGRTAAAAPQGDFQIVLRPTRVFKTADRSHENTESWIFSAVVQTATPAALTPERLTVDALAAGKLVRTTTHQGEGFAAITYKTAFPPRLADGRASPAPIHWPFVVRMRGTEPKALKIDALRLRIEAKDSAGRKLAASRLVPIETYVQKAALIFPFKGKGIILQGGATNGGHRNRSGAYALDACGLDDAWSIMAPGDSKAPSAFRGWGRELLAPADGTIVRLRSDRPDQPVNDESNPKYYALEYPDGGDPGNHLIIDHGAGEFSMLAHFQAGSMRVDAGERVRQGQVLGALGQSGDTNAPHLHYQLQSGPDWEYADALPATFANVDAGILDRGTYFEAK